MDEKCQKQINWKQKVRTIPQKDKEKLQKKKKKVKNERNFKESREEKNEGDEVENQINIKER